MSSSARQPTVILAGGGTGGHVYPLIAVAEALREVSPEVRAVFVGTARGIETRVVPKAGFALELVRVLPIRGMGTEGAIRGSARAFMALPESRSLLRRLAPSVVLTVGGYAAGPISLMARLSGIPVALLEPNAVMGLANRLMAPIVQRGYTAFALAERHFGSGKVLRSGVPIRTGFLPRPLVLEARPRRVLVIGGSQGARTLNENVPAALGALGTELEVTHQCGRDDVALVQDRYRAFSRVDAKVTPFIDEMPQAIAWADLVVSRSGASAVSEICSVGRPSLLIPYPFAAGNHQQLNAEGLAGAQAALWVKNADATPETLSREISRLLFDERQLQSMADAATRYGRPFAARDIASDLLQLAGLHVKERVDGTIGDTATVPGLATKENV